MADANPTKSGHSLTARELEVVCAALKNIKGGGEIQVDYTGMASALGLKNEPSASSMWARVKKKLYTEGGRSAASADGPASDADTKPNTSSKMKDSNVDVTTPATPTPATPKKRGRKSNAVKAAEAAAAVNTGDVNKGDEDGPPPKKARKPPAKKSAVAAATDLTDDANVDVGATEATMTETDRADLEV